MSLTDLMSNADLTVWPQAAMAIFIGVFALVTHRTIFVSRREEMDRRAALALEEGSVIEPGDGARTSMNEENSHE